MINFFFETSFYYEPTQNIFEQTDVLSKAIGNKYDIITAQIFTGNIFLPKQIKKTFCIYYLGGVFSVFLPIRHQYQTVSLTKGHLRCE